MRVEFESCVEQMQLLEKVIMMSQQEMNYSQMGYDGPQFASGGYQGTPLSNAYGEKLSGQAVGSAPTAGQRLALAIVSLAMFMGLTFGLIVMAAALHAEPWVVFPVLFILVLFSSVAAIINIVFNRKS